MIITIFQWVGMIFCSAVILCSTAIVISLTSDCIAKNQGLLSFFMRLLFGRKFAQAFMQQVKWRKQIQEQAKSQSEHYMREIEDLKRQLEEVKP